MFGLVWYLTHTLLNYTKRESGGYLAMYIYIYTLCTGLGTSSLHAVCAILQTKLKEMSH
jgi:hypothetical protein